MRGAPPFAGPEEREPVLPVRTMYTLYWLVILAGIVLYTAVGAVHG